MRSRALATGLVVVAVAAATATAPRAQAPAVDDVKAAFLLNFTRYVEWPAHAGTGPFRLCLLAPTAFSARVAATVAGEHVAGRTIEVVEPHSAEEAARCNVLHVDRSAMGRFEKMAPALKGHPVLTVGDDDGFHERTGVIRLFLDGNRFRFTIHAGHAQAAGLRVSARLLRLAARVYGPAQ